MTSLHVVDPDDDTDDSDDGTLGEDYTGPEPLFPGDVGQLSLEVRETLITLLKRRYVSADRHPTDWRIVLENEATLQTRLNDMFLELVIDRDYEVAYKRQALSGTGTKFATLLYDKEYNREETVLLVHLRRLIRSSQKAGDDRVFVDRGELVEEVANYRPASATNHVRDERAANNAVDSLLKNDILLRTPEADRYRVSPIIEVLLPVDRIKQLADWLKAENGTQRQAEDTPDRDVVDTEALED